MKRYWALWDSLRLRNGVLHRKWESEDGKTFKWQIILPNDVEKCCRTCDSCTARKEPRNCTRGRLQLYNVGAPFERIVFDILGSLPRSSDGNNIILVVMDCFTKWNEAYTISDQEASTVAEVLVHHRISRFGVPQQLHSHQGRNFDSGVCKRLCEIFVIDKTRTTALHLITTGLGQEIALSPAFYRSAFHETTGYFPSQMLFGRDLRLPADLLFNRPPDAPLACEEYIKQL
ncbi:retrovirus-related Pol polyprotein from transposon 412 [Trichonephila clavipes]|nr:retrovirus-related Pol polyprotein from transposon 412 [Trichonephila clavipes]